MAEQRIEGAITAWLSGLGPLPPLLSPSQEIELGRSIRAWLDAPPPCPARVERRGRRALDRMVASNLRLVPRFYRRWGRRYVHVPVADALQNGAIGLHRAAQRFDPERGYKFSTYSAMWIRQAFQRSAAADYIVRLPSDVLDFWHGAVPRHEPITRDRLDDAERWRGGVHSLDHQLSPEGSELHELIEGSRLEVESIDAELALEALAEVLGDGAILLELRTEAGKDDVADLVELAGVESPRQLSNVLGALRRRGRRLPEVRAVLAA